MQINVPRFSKSSNVDGDLSGSNLASPALRGLRKAQEQKRKATKTGLLDFVKRSFARYQAGWVHRDICERLERFSESVTRGESPRLMLFIPPRHGKSFIVSERFPVWHLGNNPDHQVVVASYGQNLSNKFSKRARALAREPFVAEAFPDLKLDQEKQAIEEWETTAGGGYKAVGVGGGLTGSGAHVLIIDDPVKDQEQADSETYRERTWEWYTSTAYTRLMPGGGVLVIMTRWHQDDLAGRLKREMDTGEGDQWEIIEYPAIAEEDEKHRKAGEALDPDRYPLKRLWKIMKAVGSRAWNALYQQRPSPAEGGMLKRGWWQFYRQAPSKFDEIIQSWDATFKDTKSSDFVVGQVWGRLGADKYLLDQVRGRMDFTATIQAIRMLSAKWPQARAKLIEDKANGPAIINTLKREIPGLIPIEPQGSKEARVSAVSPDIEAGNVYLPDGAPWVGDFVEECAAFPAGANDDQVDGMSQALLRFHGKRPLDLSGVQTAGKRESLK